MNKIKASQVPRAAMTHAIGPQSKVFLLSPANMRGVRAAQLHHSKFQDSSSRVRNSSTRHNSNTERRASNAIVDELSIEEAFTYTSSLYFRGKIAYARRFLAPPVRCAPEGIYIIAPGFGLVLPDWKLDVMRFRRLQNVPVDPRSRAYSTTLEADARALAARLDPDTTVVLLGSLAHNKYLPVLAPVFGDRLHAPLAFVGTGDMRRGALLLQAVGNGEELDYLLCSELMMNRPPRPRRTMLCR